MREWNETKPTTKPTNDTKKKNSTVRSCSFFWKRAQTPIKRFVCVCECVCSRIQFLYPHFRCVYENVHERSTRALFFRACPPYSFVRLHRVARAQQYIDDDLCVCVWTVEQAERKIHYICAELDERCVCTRRDGFLHFGKLHATQHAFHKIWYSLSMGTVAFCWLLHYGAVMAFPICWLQTDFLFFIWLPATAVSLTYRKVMDHNDSKYEIQMV